MTAALRNALQRRLIFVGGKGGVGKTVLSQAIASALAARGKKVLWVAFEDPFLPEAKREQVAPHLFHVNIEAAAAFEEYVGMKIGVPGLTRIFLQNKVVRYLAKAAPGLHELVLLGKVWFERDHYDHVVADMPSTGYALAMFQSTKNFSDLFGGGPLHNDAEAMLRTFRDPQQTAQIIVALPEEMPLQESLELRDHLLRLLPGNQPHFVLNRKFPDGGAPRASLEVPSQPTNPAAWQSPIATSGAEYVQRRHALEEYNVRIWRNADVEFETIDYFPPPLDSSPQAVVHEVQRHLESQGLV